MTTYFVVVAAHTKIFRNISTFWFRIDQKKF